MPKVLVAERLCPSAIRLLQDRGFAVEERPGLTPAELTAALADADGLVVRSGTKVTAAMLAGAPRLKVIGRAGSGVENIDVEAASNAGVVVMNTPFYNTMTTAEHAIALLFALAREVVPANASTKAGKWERGAFAGVELMGKTLGLIGCGNIGAVVAERAQALKMHVIAFDPFLSSDRAGELNVEKVDLETVLARSDFLSLHTRLTPATRGIICADSIARMKPGVRIVNCALGGLINEADLKAAIESGHVAGAALDVFAEEPALSNPLFGLDRVICTPHSGAGAAEAIERAAEQIASHVADFLQKGAISNAVNMPAMTPEEAKRVRPYMALASQLGSFAGQLTDSAVTEVVVEYEGDAADMKIRPLTGVVMEAFLRHLFDGVNMVNALEVAQAHGIGVVEKKAPQAGSYHALIRVTVTTEQFSRSVAGTLFGGDKPRVVDIKGIPIEAEMGANMLYVTNEDKPGFIGALGSLLGEHKINIATFHLGRTSAGGDAICLVQVDQILTEDMLNKVRALPHVVQAKALRF